MAQADAPFRAQAEDILALKTRNAAGEMVPLGTLVTVQPTPTGPIVVDALQRYPRRRHQRRSRARHQLRPGHGRDREDRWRRRCPSGMRFEWTELTYQQSLAGNTALLVFPLCVLLVFLVLAAQYESWSLPLAIILIVPMCLLFAIVGVWLHGGDNNIFTQIGFIVLVGLACKNAILIVEFAKHLEEQGLDARSAAIEAAVCACGRF